MWLCTSPALTATLPLQPFASLGVNGSPLTRRPSWSCG